MRILEFKTFLDHLPIELHGTGRLDSEEPDFVRGLGGDSDDLEVEAVSDRRRRQHRLQRHNCNVVSNQFVCQSKRPSLLYGRPAVLKPYVVFIPPARMLSEKKHDSLCTP